MSYKPTWPQAEAPQAPTPYGEQKCFNDEIQAYNKTYNWPSTVFGLVFTLAFFYILFRYFYANGTLEHQQKMVYIGFLIGLGALCFLGGASYSRRPSIIIPMKERAEAKGTAYGESIFRRAYWQVEKVDIEHGIVTARPLYPGNLELDGIEFYIRSTGDPFPRIKPGKEGISFQRNELITNTPWYRDAMQAATIAANTAQQTEPAVCPS